MIKKPELLAPAGNFEKLEIAIHYGADAVYLAGKDFSLRNFSGNFTRGELESAIRLAHEHGVKVYVAVNIYTRNFERGPLEDYLKEIGDLAPDAVIVSDPGVISLCRSLIPHIDIHLSTQANTTNFTALEFWKENGVKRVNLARELSLKEIQEISVMNILQTEVFIHGAMCVSYSGRCLLSSFLSQRDSNRGLCSHPCRWRYAVVEEQRPGEFMPIMEDTRGTYLFNSRDLCMIDHIPELVDAGISSLKIEGRMKGVNYLATVLKTYRSAIDSYCRNPEAYTVDPKWHSELNLIFNRTYSTGFYLSNPDDGICNWQNLKTGQIHSFIGKIISAGPDGAHQVEIRNKLSLNDTVEVITPGESAVASRVLKIFNTKGDPIDHAQPNTVAEIVLNTSFSPNDILRKI